MSKINHAIYNIQEINELADRKNQINLVHPLIKLLATISYLICVISFDKYDFFGLFPMLLYPLLIHNIAELSIKKSLQKILLILPLICFVGIVNPFLDHSKIYEVFGITITGGTVSLVTLMLKGMYSLLASYLLIATTGIEGVCYALSLLHIPDIIVTQIFLVYRYMIVLMNEANAVIEAYSLRAPKEKGIHYKVWGTFFGQLLLRSFDRAEKLYDSMQLRGFHNKIIDAKSQKINKKDVTYLLLSLIIIIGLRVVNMEGIIGKAWLFR